MVERAIHRDHVGPQPASWRGLRSSVARRAAVLALLCAALSAGIATAAPLDVAARDVAEQFVAKLGSSVSFRTVAVLPLTGDTDHAIEIALSDALRTATTAGGAHVTVVDRTNLDRVVGELARQGQVEFDEKTAARVGELLNAEAIVFGSVEERRANPLYAQLRVLLKVDRVEEGSVLDAGAFSASTVSQVGLLFGFVALGAVGVAGGLAGFRAWGRARKKANASGDRDAVARLRAPIAQAKRLLDEAQSRLLAGQKAEGAQAIRDVSRAVLELEQGIENVPVPELSRARADVKAALRFDETLMKPLEGLVGVAREVLDATSDAVGSDGAERLAAKTKVARDLVAELSVRLRDRARHLR